MRFPKTDKPRDAVALFVIALLMLGAGVQMARYSSVVASWLQCKSPVAEGAIDQPTHLNSKALIGTYEPTSCRATVNEEVIVAVHALASTRSNEAHLALRQIVGSATPFEVQKVALHALCSQETAEQLSYLAGVAMESERLSMRKTAIHALRSSDHASAIAALSEIATGEHHLALRKAAVASLEHIATPEANEALVAIIEQSVRQE